MRAILLTVALCAVAFADENPQVRAAREAFVEGTELVKKSQWADALVAFEKSARLHPHATTTFNIGGCQRVLGRYTLARVTLARALKEGEQLPRALASDAEAFIGEIDRLLVRVTVELAPAEAEITVDGRPLAAQPDGTVVAGLLPPGHGAAAPAGRFELTLDPGAHVFVLSRQGYTDAVVHRSFAPGTRARLELQLERLPATLHVTATQPGAVISVDGIDVGAAPIDLQRPPGEYRVLVRKLGFVPYETRVALRAGEETGIQAAMAVEKIPVYKKWWFWTSLIAVVAGGATLTYFLTRPPPPYDGGNTNWVITP